MKEPPIPVETGTSGTQKVGTFDLTGIDATPPTHGLHIVKAMEGLVENNARSFGGEVTSKLLVASFIQISHELDAARKELRTKDDQLKKSQDELGNANTRIAVLKERLGSVRFYQTIQQISSIIGATCIAITIDLYKNNLINESYILGTFGTILLLASLLKKRTGIDE